MFIVTHDVQIGSGDLISVSEIAQSLSFALPGSFPQTISTVEAQENVGGHRAVTMMGTYCDQNNLNLLLGVSQGAAMLGDIVSVVRKGKMEESSWNWIPNQPIFTSDFGILTQSPPLTGPIRRLAWAVTATIINIHFSPIIQQ